MLGSTFRFLHNLLPPRYPANGIGSSHHGLVEVLVSLHTHTWSKD